MTVKTYKRLVKLFIALELLFWVAIHVFGFIYLTENTFWKVLTVTSLMSCCWLTYLFVRWIAPKVTLKFMEIPSPRHFGNLNSEVHNAANKFLKMENKNSRTAIKLKNRFHLLRYIGNEYYGKDFPKLSVIAKRKAKQ